MGTARTGEASFPEEFNDVRENRTSRPAAVASDSEDEAPDDRLTTHIPRLSLDFEMAVRGPRRRSPILGILARARALKPRSAARPR